MSSVCGVRFMGPLERLELPRIRPLLYAGKPNWDQLATITRC